MYASGFVFRVVYFAHRGVPARREKMIQANGDVPDSHTPTVRVLSHHTFRTDGQPSYASTCVGIPAHDTDWT